MQMLIRSVGDSVGLPHCPPRYFHVPYTTQKAGFMKLLVDKCLSEELAKLARQRGHAEASHRQPVCQERKSPTGF
jgi:hypothetical protein